VAGPKLDPRPLAIGGGEATRIGRGSTLAALRPDFSGIDGEACFMFLGIEGTGGASGALGTGCDRPGEGSRNVRSDNDPELPRRWSCDPDGPFTDPALPMEEAEPDLRRVLFVCTSATEVGVVGRDRRAAAAAAEESEAFEAWFFRKAEAAAVAAEGLALELLRGCFPRYQYRFCSSYVVLVCSKAARLPCSSKCDAGLAHRHTPSPGTKSARTGFDAALLLLFPNMSTSGAHCLTTSADQGLMRILLHREKKDVEEMDQQ